MNRSEYVANRDMKVALETMPVRASVQALYRIREIKRARGERRARLGVCILVPLMGVLLFIGATGGI